MRLTVKNALASLLINPGRSSLTILGIVIGIVAIVLVIALGEGAQKLILGEIENFGANFIIIRPGRQPEGPTDLAESILGDSLKQNDIVALRRSDNVPGIISVDPAVLVTGEASYRENIYRPLILGWTPEAIANGFNIVPEEGTTFSDEDIKNRAKLAVIGAKVKRELFGESPALGQTIKIRGHNIRVIGVYPPRGQVLSFNLDELVLLPYSTAQRELLGIDYYAEVFVRTDTAADPELVAQDIRATLRETHGITDPNKDDFFVWTQQDITNRLRTVTNVLTVFLVAMASISLVVGGVGIMNIMLVAVTERTREIGLRKAVGATNQDILRQFLSESIMLTAAGGIIGTALALTLAIAVTVVARYQYQIDWPLALPLRAFVLGIGMSSLIGVVFGIFPARQAAQKDPIDALRYE